MPWPSMSRLAEATGLGRRAVIVAVQGLVAAGAVRIELKRPLKDGRLLAKAKPTNHYHLEGLMRLPVREEHQCTSDTSAPDAPVHETSPTGAREAPVLVH